MLKLIPVYLLLKRYAVRVSYHLLNHNDSLFVLCPDFNHFVVSVSMFLPIAFKNFV